MTAQLSGVTTESMALVAAQIVGVAVLAGVVAGLVALGYRWYVRERVPSGLSLLFGLTAVSVSLSTTTLLANEINDGPAITTFAAAVHVATFLAGGVAARAGGRVGDRAGIDLFAASGTTSVDGDVSDVVKAVGRVITVQLPDEVEDVVGYDPVPDETKKALAGRRFIFPRRLTKAELRDRLATRLETDYGVGHVDVELAADGTVDYLAVGSRAAGIGPTLPPASNAVAIRADPAHAAGPGDLVQVWRTDPPERVTTGELRGVAGDVVTVVVDAADVAELGPDESYRLVTLPVGNRPDREFASLLRAADETLATVTVEAGSDLDGAALDGLDVTVAAITRRDRSPEPLPARDRTLAAGDVVYAVATPDVLRRVEAAARGEKTVDSGADGSDDDQQSPAAVPDEPGTGGDR